MKVADLIDFDLDRWVARALGATFKLSSIGAEHAYVDGRFIGGFVTKTPSGVSMPDRVFQPSADWAAAGPIIEREEIGVNLHCFGKVWGAWIKSSCYENGKPDQVGPTPLIAAMRAFVASKFGSEVSE